MGKIYKWENKKATIYYNPLGWIYIYNNTTRNIGEIKNIEKFFKQKRVNGMNKQELAQVKDKIKEMMMLREL